SQAWLFRSMTRGAIHERVCTRCAQSLDALLRRLRHKCIKIQRQHRSASTMLCFLKASEVAADKVPAQLLLLSLLAGAELRILGLGKLDDVESAEPLDDLGRRPARGIGLGVEVVLSVRQ